MHSSYVKHTASRQRGLTKGPRKQPKGTAQDNPKGLPDGGLQEWSTVVQKTAGETANIYTSYIYHQLSTRMAPVTPFSISPVEDKEHGQNACEDGNPQDEILQQDLVSGGGRVNAPGRRRGKVRKFHKARRK